MIEVTEGKHHSETEIKCSSLISVTVSEALQCRCYLESLLQARANEAVKRLNKEIADYIERGETVEFESEDD